MLKARMKYGAVGAKVLAMYGKLISDEEWNRLYDCVSLGDIAALLRGQRGWSACISELSSPPTAARLKDAAKKKVFDEYEKLYKFSYFEDKSFLLFFLSRAEYGVILGALRSLYSKESEKHSFNATDFMKNHSAIDLAALEGASDYAQLLEAVKRSVYGKTLNALPIAGETGLPQYRDAGVALENRYFTEVFSYINKNYGGLGKKQLAELLGTQADILNLVSLLRLQRSFPSSLSRTGELLIPISYRLTPALVRSLQGAKNEAESLELLKRSHYAKQFESYSPQNLDELYGEAMSAFCRKLIKMPEPNLCVPAAYLILSELECQRLLRLIQAVSYGIKLSME